VAAYISRSLLVCVCCTVRLYITVTLARTNNALPDGGVTAPKHVGAVLL
jgi:hypothetical protein